MLIAIQDITFIQCILPDLFICAGAGIAAHCHWLARSLWIHTPRRFIDNLLNLVSEIFVFANWYVRMA